jgi:hypothetical protein
VGCVMALPLCSRIDRRRAILGMLAAGSAAALPAEGVSAADVGKAYAAFFLGQGGYLFSWGIPHLASEARRLGLTTDIFSYTDVKSAWTNILRRRKEGYRIALVGYSLGNTTATYLQRHLAVDLLLAISESSLGRNHPIKKENTKRSVLWYGPDTLSNAGVHDGFDETNYIDNTHLLMDVDPRVVQGVLAELKRLIAPERREEQIVAANGLTPKPTPPRSRQRPEDNTPVQRSATALLSPAGGDTPDATCKNCWGFTQSLSGTGSDPWMQ